MIDSLAPSIVIPAPSAWLESVAPLAIKIFLSSTFNVETLSCVVSPSTVKSPLIVTSSLLSVIAVLNDCVNAFSASVAPSREAVAVCNELVVAWICVLKSTGLPIPAIVDDWITVLAICTTPPSTLNMSPASDTPEDETFTAVDNILDVLPFLNGTLCSTLIGMKLLLIS